MTIDFERLDARLRATAVDHEIDVAEKHELRALGTQLDAEQIRRLRNTAFAIARELIGSNPDATFDVLRWLEQVVRTLDVAQVVTTAATTAYFSPGDTCLRALQSLLSGARKTLDICVFTIADDRLTDAILDAQRRGVSVRIITDDDKRFDTGSDVSRLAAAGIAVRTDRAPVHMHHKFAIADGTRLANGSFNWTRSASIGNDENLVLSEDAGLVRVFAAQFERLWKRFAPGGSQ